MRVLKERVPKIRIRPSASVLILMVVAAATAISSPVLLPASAQEHGTPRTDPGQPDDPDCWGEVSSTVAQRDDDQSGLGEHASNPIPDDPVDEVDHDTPRLGVGNQDDDTPPEHGADVGKIVGGCQPDRNDP